MKLNRINSITDWIIEISQGLLLLLAIIMFILFVAAIAYGLWESIAGMLFHVDRNSVAIVAAIGLCGMQIRSKK